jgi:hypothetical protein
MKIRWRLFPRCVIGCEMPGTMIRGSRNMRLAYADREVV